MEAQIQNNLESSETKSQKRLLEKSFSEGDSQIPIELLVGRTDLKELSCLLLSPGLDEGGMVLESWCGCQAGREELGSLCPGRLLQIWTRTCHLQC